MIDLGLPDGPGTLVELFDWASFNARQLLVNSPLAEEYRKNFAELLPYPLHVHDAYSGTGSGSITLHKQYNQLVRTSSVHCVFVFCSCDYICLY